MGQQLRLAALPEDSSLVLSTHVGQLTTTCKSSFRGCDTLFWLLQTPHTCMDTYT